MPLNKEEFEEFSEETYAEEQKRLKEEKKEERRKNLMSIQIVLTPEERKNFEYILKRENFVTRQEFHRKIVLDFIDEKLKFYKVLEEVDKEFIEEYRKFRKEYLESVNKMKKMRNEMINAMAQDEGGDPFTEDELSRS